MKSKEQTLKNLQTNLEKIRTELKVLKLEISNKQKEYFTKQQIEKSLVEQIQSFNINKPLKASEHSILRYLERAKGINIKEIEKEMIDEQLLKLTDVLGGNGTYPAANNQLQYVIRNNIIITVKDPNQKKQIEDNE